MNTNSLKFIPAKCPSCGGELRVPEGKDSIICMYCGSEVLLRNKSKLLIEPYIDVEKYINLANEALEADNYKEAYRYFSMVLEQDPSISDAWLGKGYCAGMLSTKDNLRIKELEKCYSNGLYEDKEKFQNLDVRSDASYWDYYVAKIDRLELKDKYNVGWDYYQVSSYIGGLCKIQDFNQYSSIGQFNEDLISCQDILLKSLALMFKAYMHSDDNAPFSLEYKCLKKSEAYTIILSNIKLLISIHSMWCSANNISGEGLLKVKRILFKQIGNSAFDHQLLNDAQIKLVLNNYLNDSKRDKKCFIASATMGSEYNYYVNTLKRFRDELLAFNRLGRFIVFTYYKLSPPIAYFISKSQLLRKVSFLLIVSPWTYIADHLLEKNKKFS